MIKKLYFISYDLIKNRDYDKIINELERLGAIRVLESVWAFKYNANSSVEIRDHLKSFIDHDDRLLVIESGGWAGLRLLESPKNL